MRHTGVVNLRKGMRTIWGLSLVVLVLFLVQINIVHAETPGVSVVSIGERQQTQWMYIHSSPIASKLIIEFGGGRVAVDPTTNYALAASVTSSMGVGGLFMGNEIDELLLLSYPRNYILTIGDPLSILFNTWLEDSVAWAWSQGYKEVYGYGYSAGATVWMRYALSDEFGHNRQNNKTVTGIIVKAYPNQSCYECFQYAANYTLPILFLSGTEDAVAPLAGVQAFYSLISSTTKHIITFPTGHNGMAEIFPTAEQEWLINGTIPINEFNSAQFTPILILLVTGILFIRKKRAAF